MATVVMFPEKSPDQLAEEWLHSAPFKFVACRGLGHAFPKPKKKNSSGFQLTVDADGWSTLRMVCRDCEMVRYVFAEPGAVIRLPAKRYKYDVPKGYRIPKGTAEFISRAICAEETLRRAREEVAHPTGGEDMELDEGKQDKLQHSDAG